jgi:hypothetical protein
MIGVSMAVVINAGAGMVSSFLVFWLVFGEQIKTHDINGSTVYLAPAWLVCILIGLAGVVYAPLLKLSPSAMNRDEPILPKSSSNKKVDDHPLLLESDRPLDERNDRVATRGSAAVFTVGVVASVFGGLFSSLQYGLVTCGKHYEQEQQHCRHATSECPALTKEQFNGFGSWVTSFGIGAALGSLFWLGLLYAYQWWLLRRRGTARVRTSSASGSTSGSKSGSASGALLPSYPTDDDAIANTTNLTNFHFDVMAVPGTVHHTPYTIHHTLY